VDKIGVDDCDLVTHKSKSNGFPCNGWNSEFHPTNPGARAKAGPNSNVVLVENLRPFGRFMQKRKQQQ
jgi:hypothetical protein